DLRPGRDVRYHHPNHSLLRGAGSAPTKTDRWTSNLFGPGPGTAEIDIEGAAVGISSGRNSRDAGMVRSGSHGSVSVAGGDSKGRRKTGRSEEHTSELQSREHLV